MSTESSGTVGSGRGNGAATDGNAGSNIDTASVGPVDSIASGDSGKRRGGWPKGKPRGNSDGDRGAGSGSGGNSASAGRKTGAQKETLDLSGIEAALVGIHAGLAALTKNPIWEMQSDEASSVAKAATNVARHYPSLAGHEKLVDWVMLIQTLGMVYGTRFYLSMPEKPKTKSPPANVAPFAVPSAL